MEKRGIDNTFVQRDRGENEGERERERERERDDLLMK